MTTARRTPLRLRLYRLSRRIASASRRVRANAAYALLPAELAERRTNARLAMGPDDFWLFLVGATNSGTTLLSALIAEHPRVRTLPDEGHLLTDALPVPAKLGHGRMWTEHPELYRWEPGAHADRARRAKHDWSLRYPPGPGVLLEKSPPNAARVRWLAHHFAPARFIMLTRSPYAVAEGIRRRMGRTLEDAARQWRLTHEWWEDDKRDLAHTLHLHYESLCADPVATLERIGAFCDFDDPYDPAVARKAFPVHNVTGEAAAITDFNAKSIAALSDEDLDAIEHAAAPVAERLGYPRPTR